MDKELLNLSHDQIIQKSIKKLNKKHSIFEPTAFLFELNGNKYVYKAFPKRTFFHIPVWNGFILRNEYKILGMLNDMESVPKILHIIENHGYIMEYIDGTVLSHFRFNRSNPDVEKFIIQSPEDKYKTQLTPEFFDRTIDLLKIIHDHGIAHNDIRKKNILLNIEGNPVLIDFATAIYKGEKSGFIKRYFFETMKRIDLITLIKIKSSYFPESISEDEKALMKKAPLILKLGKFIRQNIYKNIKKILGMG